MPGPDEAVGAKADVGISDAVGLGDSCPEVANQKRADGERERKEQNHDGSWKPAVFSGRVSSKHEPDGRVSQEGIEQRERNVDREIDVRTVLTK